MRALRRRLRSESGFSLIELVAAMTIFSLAAGAVLAVLVAGIRTAAFARDRTIGKDLARERIEEMRRLPFYLSNATFNRPVDLLDFYFPDLTSGCANLPGAGGSAGYEATGFTYTCTISSVPGFGRYRMDIVSDFVETDVATGALVAKAPAAGYSWNGADSPPTRFLRVEVRTSWTSAGRANAFSLRSLIGESRLETVLTQGSVSGSVVRIGTAFSDQSTLVVEGGTLTSTLYRGNVTTSRNDTLSGLARVTLLDGTFGERLGAQLAAGAPPDTTISTVTKLGDSLVHPNAAIAAQVPIIAAVGDTTVTGVEAKVTAVLPEAQGETIVQDTGADGTVGLSARNEVTAGFNFFDATKDFVRVVKVGGNRPLKGRSSCRELVGPDTVTCETEEVRVGELQTAPADFSALLIEAPPPLLATNGYIVTVSFDTIKVRARAARVGGGGTASALTQFSGTLTYHTYNGTAWVANQVCIRSPDQSACPVGAATTLPAPSTVCVVPAAAGGCLVPLSQFVDTWSRLTDGTRSTSDPTSVEATLNGVLSITTTPTNSLYANTGFIVSIGNLTAQAVDKR